MHKYLVVVEKPYIKKLFENVFESIRTIVNFEIDIVVANNHILDLNSHIIYDLNGVNHERLVLGGQLFPDNYRLICDEVYRDYGDAILWKVENNSYDAIINMCDPDEVGDMIFRFTLESLNLNHFKTGRILCRDLTDSTIRDSLFTIPNSIQ